jgi:hypothetical protein
MAKAIAPRIYRFAWKPTPDGFEGWVVGHPAVRATAPTFSALEEVMGTRVRESLSPAEWTFDWSPVPPKQPGKIGSILDTHVHLGADGTFFCFQDPKELFDMWCDSCGMQTSPRTKAPLRVIIDWPGNSCSDSNTAPGQLQIISVELAKALEPIVGKHVKFRPVERLGRGRKSFVEPIVPRWADLPTPVAAHCDNELGWLCESCGHKFSFHDFQYDHDAYIATTFHRRTDLPLKRKFLPMRNSSGSVDLCVPAPWWSANRRKPIAAGVVGIEIGVLKSREINSTPRLRAHEACPSYRSYWHERQQRLASAHSGVALWML